MNELLPMITERDGIPVTTSKAVAEYFGKQHKHILRDIEELLEQLSQPNFGPANADFAKKNFAFSEYHDLQGKPRPCYIMTKDGFTLLAMGFTGAKALQFKIAYINAFDRMEKLIKNGGTSSLTPTLQGLEARINALEAALSGTEEKDSILKAFTDVIAAALDEGTYYLHNRRTRGVRIPDDKILLGAYDRNYVYLISTRAYGIYKAKAKAPLEKSGLYSYLVSIGAAEPNPHPHRTQTRTTQIVKIRGHEYSSLVLYRDKLNMTIK